MYEKIARRWRSSFIIFYLGFTITNMITILVGIAAYYYNPTTTTHTKIVEGVTNWLAELPWDIIGGFATYHFSYRKKGMVWLAFAIAMSTVMLGMQLYSGATFFSKILTLVPLLPTGTRALETLLWLHISVQIANVLLTSYYLFNCIQLFRANRALFLAKNN